MGHGEKMCMKCGEELDCGYANCKKRCNCHMVKVMGHKGKQY